MSHKKLPRVIKCDHTPDATKYHTNHSKITKKVDIGKLRCDPSDFAWNDSLYVSNKNDSLEQNFNG